MSCMMHQTFMLYMYFFPSERYHIADPLADSVDNTQHIGQAPGCLQTLIYRQTQQNGYVSIPFTFTDASSDRISLFPPVGAVPTGAGRSLVSSRERGTFSLEPPVTPCDACVHGCYSTFQLCSQEIRTGSVLAFLCSHIHPLHDS